MEALLGESLREVQTRLYWSFSLASQGSWEAYEAFMELKSRFSSAASGRPKIQAALAGLEERLLQKVQSGDIQCGAY